MIPVLLPPGKCDVPAQRGSEQKGPPERIEGEVVYCLNFRKLHDPQCSHLRVHRVLRGL